jgi:hypothetical protein
VSHVQQQQQIYWGEENYDDGEWDKEVNMVGSCFTCGGKGHPARLCPSEKGNKGGGKGGGKKGFGKGGKGGFGGYDAGKGKGKSKGGFKGECWTCGKTGHRSNECRSGQQVNNVEGQMYEEHHAPLEPEQQTRIINGVGGVWSMSKQIGHVDKVKKVTVISPNKFGALQTDDEDDFECSLCVYRQA